MTQGVPEAGREVGLMYSFSSQSDDDLSPLDTAGRDLTTNAKHNSQTSINFLSLYPHRVMRAPFLSMKVSPCEDTIKKKKERDCIHCSGKRLLI